MYLLFLSVHRNALKSNIVYIHYTSEQIVKQYDIHNIYGYSQRAVYMIKILEKYRLVAF